MKCHTALRRGICNAPGTFLAPRQTTKDDERGLGSTATEANETGFTNSNSRPISSLAMKRFEAYLATDLRSIPRSFATRYALDPVATRLAISCCSSLVIVGLSCALVDRPTNLRLRQS